MKQLLAFSAFALLCGALAARADVLPSAPARSSGNISGTVATGGTFQSLAVANPSRLSIEFENICNVSGNCNATTDNCYLWWTSTGTPSSPTKATSLTISPGSYYGRFQGTVPSDAFQVTCDGNSDKYWSEVQ